MYRFEKDVLKKSIIENLKNLYRKDLKEASIRKFTKPCRMP